MPRVINIDAIELLARPAAVAAKREAAGRFDRPGELRIGDERHALRSGDFVACPSGAPETGHQIANTGDGELGYVAVSTQEVPEICQYPDSGKFLVIEWLSAADGSVSGFRHLGRPDSALDYRDGE